MADDTNRYVLNPVTTATAYATADAFGAPMAGQKFSPNGLTGAFIQHYDAVLRGTIAVPLDVMIFNGNLTTAVLDNGVFALAAADQLASKLVARFTIAVADWVAIPGAVGGAFSAHKDIAKFFIGGAGDYTVAFVVGAAGPFTPTVANGLTLSLVSDQADAAH